MSNNWVSNGRYADAGTLVKTAAKESRQGMGCPFEKEGGASCD